MFGFIKRWSRRPKQKMDPRPEDYSMGRLYAAPDRLRHDQTQGVEHSAMDSVYPNNYRATPSIVPGRTTAGSFQFIDPAPEAPKQRLDDPEELLFLNKKTGEQISLSSPAATIGRGTECTIVLGNAFVSSLHAALTFEGGFWYIQDRSSSNGTKLNGVQLKPDNNYLLCPHDRILFAYDEEFLVLSGSSDEERG